MLWFSIGCVVGACVGVIAMLLLVTRAAWNLWR